MKLYIKELDLNTIRPNVESIKTNLGGSKLCIIGKAGSGKSCLIRNLIFSKRHIIPVGCVISGTEENNHFYENMFPNIFIYSDYNKSVVESLKERQKIAKEYLKNPWSIFIMDDCMDDLRIFNDPLMVGFFKNSRHWDCLSIFSNQYVLDFKPNIRTNIDGVFIFREPNVANRQKIYNNFASIIPTYNLFNQIMDEITGDYTCLYINNQIQSNQWQDCVMYFKASLIPDFKFGCQEYWDFALTRQKKQHYPDEDQSVK